LFLNYPTAVRHFEFAFCHGQLMCRIVSTLNHIEN
jgi:hypothetical protein